MTVQDPGRHKGEASVTAASPEKTSHVSSTAWLSIFFLLQGMPEACRLNGLPPALPCYHFVRWFSDRSRKPM